MAESTVPTSNLGLHAAELERLRSLDDLCLKYTCISLCLLLAFLAFYHEEYTNAFNPLSTDNNGKRMAIMPVFANIPHCQHQSHSPVNNQRKQTQGISYAEPLAESTSTDVQMGSQVSPNSRSITSENSTGNDLYKQVSFRSYNEALEKRASPDKDILLVYADLGVHDMALSFYESSLKKHGIENYLFVTSSSAMCQEFHLMNIPCFQFTNNSNSGTGASFGSTAFKEKMNIRTFMVLHALKEGYNVLHSDCDVYYFANPFPVIKELCGSECDVAPLWDYVTHNAGFLYTRSTTMGIALYKNMEHTALKTGRDDQSALKTAVEDCTKNGLRLVSLPTEQFQSGRLFFGDGKRTFAEDNPCSTCIVAHNNWIKGIEAKEYRFKEMHMWVYDGDEYYSSTGRKYLVYNNTDKSQSDVEALIDAFAIGQLLNRTVVLPKFFCFQKPRCTVKRICTVEDFTTRFKGRYREHSFLTHPMVPRKIKDSVGEVVLIESNSVPKSAKGDLSLVPENKEDGATSAEIVKWLSNRNESVLRFHSLYNAFWKFSDQEANSEFINNVGKVIENEEKCKRTV
ncbi:hypothetical protein CAPTEDRAFT_189031 [Capitella teleta]|uniref:Nucleotide-diphospho-sugar transferase domain-containing protein n=1 Tax=Capitella teleta TaxID=283909 RepID=R7UM24_CAPTE|nr:hypothetical protein CAPTEDRAFT_189031 [Capitella teleta]|eukprot:ELU07133.1 hypothetical protein CAPTEDRAFT_189031 [Capitella teleta]